MSSSSPRAVSGRLDVDLRLLTANSLPYLQRCCAGGMVVAGIAPTPFWRDCSCQDADAVVNPSAQLAGRYSAISVIGEQPDALTCISIRMVRDQSHFEHPPSLNANAAYFRSDVKTIVSCQPVPPHRYFGGQGFPLLTLSRWVDSENSHIAKWILALGLLIKNRIDRTGTFRFLIGERYVEQLRLVPWSMTSGLIGAVAKSLSA